MQKETKGIITDIKKFATHDGPGIRTTVFLKGCFLSCQWCANPETIEYTPQLYFIPKKCKGNGHCEQVCPEQALIKDMENKINRKKCSLCFKCTETCLNGALQIIGREVTVQEVFHEVEKDVPFYGSDGGITISGGEPFYQPVFTIELLRNCHEKRITTVVDTTGYIKPEVLNEAIKYTDLVLLDIKHMDEDKHKEGTGVSNKLILENAMLLAAKCKVRISLPLVPGFNDSEENLKETAKFARYIGVEWVDVNPLHALGTSKYEYLGLRHPYENYKEITKEDVKRTLDIMRSNGLNTTVGRMM